MHLDPAGIEVHTVNAIPGPPSLPRYRRFPLLFPVSCGADCRRICKSPGTFVQYVAGFRGALCKPFVPLPRFLKCEPQVYVVGRQVVNE
jgi:hypothetical protein